VNVRLDRHHQWMWLLLAAALGGAWGLTSLVVGLSWPNVHASLGIRAALAVISLPLLLTFWVGPHLHISVHDPSALVVLVGVVLGLIPRLACRGVQGWRGR
jgi:hypothetical protein